ncbi:hypothetical protein E2C01_061455 [Portunus trituberculatus]|uniref:Uncharacterized protein n=1 Tax=Portunus trituberculatus TaxID=210409 RepID=A0A5B7H858_PORTR|nr:hypothetical protein [Portunus trituberculatus]
MDSRCKALSYVGVRARGKRGYTRCASVINAGVLRENLIRALPCSGAFNVLHSFTDSPRLLLSLSHTNNHHVEPSPCMSHDDSSRISAKDAASLIK